DLKPDNVMICDDADGLPLVKILDFGIAKLKASGEAGRGLTRPGVVMGTPEYMPPEQAFSADKVDARADVFSLGVMFFEMLAGRRPVGGDNAHAIAAQYLKGDLPELSSLKPTINAQLAKAVHRAMAPKPEQRFDTVADFKAAIAPFAPGGAPEPRVRAASASPKKRAVAKDSPAESSPESTGADEEVPSVPKTLPPEETFVSSSPLDDEEQGAPSSDSGSDKEEAAPSDDPQSPASDETKPDRSQRAGADSSEDEADSSENEEGEGEDDGAQNADDAPSAPEDSSDADVDEDAENAAVAATEPDEADNEAPRAGSTIVGETFTPPVGQAIPKAVDAKPALRDVGPVGAIPQLPQAHAPQRRRKGVSMFANLLIALLITGGALSGAYYWDQYQQQQEDAADGDTDPPIIELDTPTTSPTVDIPATTPPPIDPPPSAWPSATATSTPTKPSSPHKTPTKPSASPTAPTKPSATPTSPPPTPTTPFAIPTGIPSVLPSTLPPGFPTSIPTIPGFPPIPGLIPPPRPQAKPPVEPHGLPVTPKPSPSQPKPAGLPRFPSIPIP
ncbi:MAG: protein kinase, partial [Polyangiaceae bacterium]